MHSFTRYKTPTSTAHLVEKNNLLKLSNYHAQSKRWGNLTRRKSDENWAKTREKRRSRTAREVVAVETVPCNSAITADRGILFSNGGSSAAWRAINFSLAADYEGRTLLFIFPRQGPLVGEIRGGNGERNRTEAQPSRGCERPVLLSPSHDFTPNLRDYWSNFWTVLCTIFEELLRILPCKM